MIMKRRPGSSPTSCSAGSPLPGRPRRSPRRRLPFLRPGRAGSSSARRTACPRPRVCGCLAKKRCRVSGENWMTAKKPEETTFTLYDLEIVVEAIKGHCTCAMTVGDRFFMRSGKLSLPGRGRFLPVRAAGDHPAAAGQAAPGRAGRLDGDRHPRRLSRSGLPADHAHRPHQPANA